MWPGYIFAATAVPIQCNMNAAAGAFAITQGSAVLPNPSLTGNTLVAFAQTGANANTFTFNDDKNNFWNKLTQVNDAGNNQSMQVAIATGATPGVQKIWVGLGNHSFSQVLVCEFTNIALGADAVDGQAGGTSSGKSFISPAYTPATDNDIILTFAAIDNYAAQSAPMVWTPGVPGSNLAALSGTGFMAMQYGTLVTHASTAPFISSSLSATTAMVKSVALKTATQGTAAPSTIYVRGVNTESAENSTTYINFSNGGTAPSFQMPTFGNLLALGYTGRPTNKPTTVTSVPALTWSSCPGPATSGGSGNTVWWWYAANATVGITSITVTGFTTTPGLMFNFIDISGADTNPFDVCSSTNDTNNLINTGAVGPVNGSTITPTTSSGLVLHLTQEDRHTVTAISPGINISPDIGIYSGSNLETDQGLGIYYNSSTSLINFILTYSGYEGGGVGPGALCSQAIAFKAAPIIAILQPSTILRGYRGPLR